MGIKYLIHQGKMFIFIICKINVHIELLHYLLKFYNNFYENVNKGVYWLT